MKSITYKLLIVMLFCSNHLLAQNVLLPYGQDTKEPWEAKYFYAIIGTEEPDKNWFEADFDDSYWGIIQGPISTNSSIPYYVTLWKENYSAYWVRRHFTVNKISDNNIFFFKSIHDDGCEAYLNGHLIYNNGNVVNSGANIDVSKDVCDYIHEGDNVLAVRVSDTGRGDAYIDFGLTSYYSKPISDPYFNSGSGWTGSYDRHSYDNNYIGYKYGSNWSCQQNIYNNPAGLYKLSANACGMEYYDDQTKASNAKDSEIPARLFINSHEKPIPSAFAEGAEADIYGEYYRWLIDGRYVPYEVDRTPAAFKRDMYKVNLYSYYEPDETNTMTVGIHSYPTNDISRWAAWDNMELTFVEEDELNSLLDSIVTVVKDLPNQHFDKNIKNSFSIYLKNAADAKSYSEKGMAFSNIINTEPAVRKSMTNYEAMSNVLAQLTDSLTKTKAKTSPATIAEANAFAQTVLGAYNNGKYTNEEVADAISTMNKLMERLGYVYLDIAVTTPGVMGDSILAKVENFVDVYSLKVSGSLNSADFSNIQSRMTSLREIDMTDVEMTVLPNNFFYQRKDLEIVKLPKQLISIGEYAFYQCYGLKHIDFPASLTTIYNYGFSECDNLQEVILPEGLISLGECAFYSCDNNKYVKLPSTLKTLNNYTFYYNVNLKSVDFAEGLTHINYCAFSGCTVLESLDFPSTLYFIGDNAFSYNKSLKTINFNEGLFQIADNAFYDCDVLTEITLPSSLVLANTSPFDYCDNLKKVTCLSIEPPYMTDQIPYGLNMEGRELYVPALSVNTYKQSTGWDKFPTIKPIDYLPENFTVLGDLHLSLPETIPADYKPNVSIIHDTKGTSYWQYGSLTINGEGTLSMNNFDMIWDPAYVYDVYDKYSTCYTSLVSNSHLRSDNVSISLNTHDGCWSFVTFPFNVRVSDIETTADGTTNWVIRKYDGQKRASGETSETWVRLTDDDMLNAGEGYIIQGSRYVGNNRQNYSSFRMNAVNDAKKNLIFNANDAAVTLNEYESEFAHNRSWNLIGNPYPCYYDTRFMDFNAPITVWNMNNNTYTAYSPTDDSYILCPGEAFFVQRPVDNGIIVFAKEGRQTNRNVRNIEMPARAKAYSQNISERSIVNIAISDGQNTDRTRVVLNDNANMGYEMDKDATKFMSSDFSVPQIYTTANGINYAINERPAADGTVNISLHIGNDGVYSIYLPENIDGVNVRLEDKLEGNTISLNSDEVYNFSAKSGNIEGRFILHFSNETTGINTIKPEESDKATYTIYGVKVNTPIQKGIYIQNGKKVIIND